MKQILTMILVAFSVSAAVADIPTPPRPRIEPGPVMEISPESLDISDVILMAKSADLSKYIKAGNTTRTGSVQHLSPEVSRYVFLRQMCMSGGVAGGTCLGGAQLSITVTTKRKGSAVQTTAVSSVAMLRGMPN